jgi:hypothetical protein
MAIKIPTFQTRARPTTETMSVTSDIQVSPKAAPALQLVDPLMDLAKYYTKEREIGYKNEAGKLDDQATIEIFNAKKEAELKDSPENGVNYFNQQLGTIVNKYKNQASNKFVQQYFVNSVNKEKDKYISSILNKTRDNLVATRVGQTDTKIKRKIFDTVHSGTKFSFSILSNEIISDYEQLEKDGMISKQDVVKFKQGLPMMIEKEMINKMAINNATQALVALDDPNNFKTLKGEDREKIRSELRTKSRFQNEVLKNASNVRILDEKKKIAEAFKGDNNQYFGIDPSQLSNYSTGNADYDNQLKNLNNKLINKTISYDTDYVINDVIIDKILNKEIENPFQRFTLPGESESMSITERVGLGYINLDDDNFFNNLFDIQNNNKLNPANKQFFNFINKVIPMIEGTPSAKIFDENYNNRLSSFRQNMYSNFVEGLNNNIPVNELLNPISDKYIAKKLLDYAPPKSDLRKALSDYAKKREEKTEQNVPKRLEGESFSSWRVRYREWKSSQKK